MGAQDEILFRLSAAGIRLKPLPDGRLWAAPRKALTDEIRALIRAHRAELLAALDPATEARRQRALQLLADNPNAKCAVVTDDKADLENVIVALAIRGRATCELFIPRDRYDGTLLLDLIDRHCETVH